MSLVRRQFEEKMPRWIRAAKITKRVELFAADARGPFGLSRSRRVLAGRQTARVRIR